MNRPRERTSRAFACSNLQGRDEETRQIGDRIMPPYVSKLQPHLHEEMANL